MSFRCDNSLSGLSLEVQCTRYTGMRMYISIFSLAFPKEKDNPAATKVNVAWDEGSYTFLAHRLEGGQKLLVPDEDAQKILRLLSEGQTLEIRVGRYVSEVHPTGFSKAYKEVATAHKPK